MQKIGLTQVIILLLIIVVVQTQSQECQQAIEEINQVINGQNSSEIIQLFVSDSGYSGKGMNRWGDYDACQRDPDSHYLIMEVLIPGLPQFIGICVSKLCSNDDLNILLAPGINDFIHNQFHIDILAFFLSPEQLVPDMTPRTPIWITIVVILVIFTLVEPVYNIYQQIIFKPSIQFNLQEEKLNVNVQVSRSEENPSIFKTESELLELNQEQAPKMGNKFFKIFSLTENIKQFMEIKTPDPNLTIFNGLRVFSFFMVIFGHQFAINVVSTDAAQVMIVTKEWLALFLADCLFSVDIFFWIGGFFLGFVMVEKKKVEILKKQGFIALPGIFLHRVLRIWPCYLICIFFLWSIEPYLAHGPRQILTQSQTDCSVWWRNVLFISTFFSDGKDCMGWGWYLSNDMQLFFMSLLPIFIYAKYSKTLAKIIIIYFMLFTQILGLIISIQQEYKIPLLTFLDPNLTAKMFEHYYIKAYCRGTVYFIGLYLGIMYREYKSFKALTKPQQAWMSKPILYTLDLIAQKKVQTKRLIHVIFYVIGFGLIIYISIGWRNAQVNAPYYWSQITQSIYFGLCRTGICIGLSFISIVGMIGIKDMFNTNFMDCTLFKFIAKLSFTGYLIHYCIIVIVSNNFYEYQEFTLFYQGTLFIGNLLITLFAALLLTLIVEQPFGKIEQIITSSLSPKKKRSENLVQQNLIEK